MSKPGCLPAGWSVSVHPNIVEIPAADWDLCAGKDHAFVQHRHLRALEESGAVSHETGFQPRHVMLRDAEGNAAAAAPAYLKTHSNGELGVDLGLAMAHERAAGPYYPKLQVEVPLTPITGPRLLVRRDLSATTARAALLSSLMKVADEAGAASLQIAYMTPDEWPAAEAAGFFLNEGNTYVWRAEGVTDFDAFLGRMHSRGRGKIRKERRKIAAQGLTFKRFAGSQIQPEWAERFFDFYKNTYERHDTEVWLNLRYFEMVFEDMRDSLVLLVALDGETWVGVLLMIKTPHALYAQHWGQSASRRFLHMELGLYQCIEYALDAGLETLDFGTTGLHKAPRGVGIEATHHAAWFSAPEFQEVAEFGLSRKREAAQAERVSETARLPFATPKVGQEREQ